MLNFWTGHALTGVQVGRIVAYPEIAYKEDHSNVVTFSFISLSLLLVHSLTGEMWSSAGSAQGGQSSSLLMLGGGSESEGEGVGGINGRPGGKPSSLIETSEVQEEVELLSQQEH